MKIFQTNHFWREKLNYLNFGAKNRSKDVFNILGAKNSNIRILVYKNKMNTVKLPFHRFWRENSNILAEKMYFTQKVGK